MKRYQTETMFEFQDDLSRPFSEVAQDQLQWYENHTTDARLRLGRLLSVFDWNDVTESE